MATTVLGKGRSAMLLSTTGAAVAGVGVGALFGRMLYPFGWSILLIGLLAHVMGMVGARRAERPDQYRRARWEMAVYWLCWLMISGLFVYFLIDQVWRGRG